MEGQNIYFNIVLPGNNYSGKDELYQNIYKDLSDKFSDYQIHAHFVTQTPLATRQIHCFHKSVILLRFVLGKEESASQQFL